MSKMSAVLPFAGFYSSVHDEQLTFALEQSFSDSSGNANTGLVNRAYDAVNWRAAQSQYAMLYAASLLDALGIKGGEFEEMTSPREYNFTTDRIFAKIPDGELERVLSETPGELLASSAKDKFTTRDGFISNYSPRVSEWGELAEWDHNQLYALLDAYAVHILGADWSENDLMENACCNGALDNCLFTDASAELKRLDTVGAYLREREERTWRKAA
jgi:hypothetical protein